MFLDEDNLLLPEKERDLYSAHEIVQMKPLYTKYGFENIMLNKNPWVRKFLPNAVSHKGSSLTSMSRWHLDIIGKFGGFFETIFRVFQLYYMRHRRTNEVIRKGYLRFHPYDARTKIISSYKKRIKKYENP